MKKQVCEERRSIVNRVIEKENVKEKYHRWPIGCGGALYLKTVQASHYTAAFTWWNKYILIVQKIYLFELFCCFLVPLKKKQTS